MTRASQIFSLAALVVLLGGCEDNMHDQARIKPFQASELFADKRSARPLPPGTIARGQLREKDEYYTGKNGAAFVPHVPITVTRETLQRGRERFNIYCALCHGSDGFGRGIVVERGFSPPPSYHIDRLRNAADGYLFDVITNGKGAMYPQNGRVPVADRWAIVAYIRALQLSQHAVLNDVPEAQRPALQEKQNE